MLLDVSCSPGCMSPGFGVSMTKAARVVVEHETLFLYLLAQRFSYYKNQSGLSDGNSASFVAFNTTYLLSKHFITKFYGSRTD